MPGLVFVPLISWRTTAKILSEGRYWYNDVQLILLVLRDFVG